MKGRESGMPRRSQWEDFFDADEIVREVSCPNSRRHVVEFGCGYGTFTVAAARLPGVGTLSAFDIDLEMVQITSDRLREFQDLSCRVEELDFLENKLPIESRSIDWVMIFNLLHVERPAVLIDEAKRVLKDAGVLSVIHWRCDLETPRGPSLGIRPTLDQCCHWCEAKGFVEERHMHFKHSPWHWGLMMRKRDINTA